MKSNSIHGKKMIPESDSEDAVLVLADGTIVEGHGFGAKGLTEGEVVFNTSMTGYQEALTDPSYKYQILMMTYPLVGNYGINDEDFESYEIQPEGFIVRELTTNPEHCKMEKDLDSFLKEYDITGLHDVDTRFLTRKIRKHGVINGLIKYPYEKEEIDDLKAKASELTDISELDLVDLVTVNEPVEHASSGDAKVVLLDCGVKHSIIDLLVERGIDVIQVPAETSFKKIMDYDPDGVFVSNGPGDPKRPSYAVETIEKVLDEQIPMFGICLGLQIIARAFGADTYKLKFGHRGSNHPVKDLETGRAHITTQNHGFGVDDKTLPEEIQTTHLSLNDDSVEGIRHKDLPVRAVQYHPEGHPGPWYNYYLFDEFVDMVHGN